MSISAQDVKKLRDMTGVGMMDAQKALSEANGDFDVAIEALRKSSAKAAAKKSDREAAEGLIYGYIHPGGKVGVLLEVNCETDFVARTDDFEAFCKDIAMHIAALGPAYVAPEDVPSDIVEKERDIYLGQLENDEKNANKPEEVKQKIIDGKIEKFVNEQCLLTQSFVKDDSMTIKAYLEKTIGKVGENIKIARFTRYSLS